MIDLERAPAGLRYLRVVQGIVRGMQARSQLLPVLRTPLLGELLAWLYLHSDEHWSVSDLAKRLGVSQSTVSREADRLVESRLVTEQRRGNMRLLQADLEGPLARPLTDLLMLSYGPTAVLGDLLAEIPGIEEAYVYGSWAARYKGEAGPVPRDIDVLVIGDADEDVVFDAARAAERLLGREVNVRMVRPKTWRSGEADPFLTSVRTRPLVAIDIGEK
jgi:DNA-binding transcriptional ArsR family regulator